MMESVIMYVKSKSEISSGCGEIEKQCLQLKGICIEVHGIFTENEIYRNGVDDGYKWLKIEICCHDDDFYDDDFYEKKSADLDDVEKIIRKNIEVDYINYDNKPIRFWA